MPLRRNADGPRVSHARGYHRIFINAVVGFHDPVDTSLTLAW